jgi:hypothetical protein
MMFESLQMLAKNLHNLTFCCSGCSGDSINVASPSITTRSGLRCLDEASSTKERLKILACFNLPGFLWIPHRAPRIGIEDDDYSYRIVGKLERPRGMILLRFVYKKLSRPFFKKASMLDVQEHLAPHQLSSQSPCKLCCRRSTS